MSKTIYITKYALSQGILERVLVESPEGSMAIVFWEGGVYNRAFFFSPDWHFNQDEAIAQAERMRKAKIASLKKQIAKLEDMSFGRPD